MRDTRRLRGRITQQKITALPQPRHNPPPAAEKHRQHSVESGMAQGSAGRRPLQRDGAPACRIVAVVVKDNGGADAEGLRLAAACGATCAVMLSGRAQVVDIAATLDAWRPAEAAAAVKAPRPSLEDRFHDQLRLEDEVSPVSHYYATSGTTGAPKVVACTRQALQLYAESHARAHNYTAASRVLLASSPLFDPFVGEVRFRALPT